MKKILIIDSHKGTNRPSTNLHWQNAAILVEQLGARMIWSYPEVNENIETGYDVIIFNHASHYAYTDYKWLEMNPDAKLFYILNDHNLGEPRTLWMAAKKGRKYTVISNNEADATKIVQKYVDEWNILNLNSLIYNGTWVNDEVKPDGCVYYGTFRKDRTTTFQKYLTGGVVISTHKKNEEKFKSISINGPFIKRLNFDEGELGKYWYSLYLEDDKTNSHYAFMANRFYEALNLAVTPIFSIECLNTIKKSRYEIDSNLIINSDKELKNLLDNPIEVGVVMTLKWAFIAKSEKQETINSIKSIINKD